VADETLRGVELAHRYADLGDVRLHYVEAGEGPLVLLLHGFPQFWYQWRHQVPALVEAGFRVVAPDMRGYNLSDKPLGVRAYRVELLARDVERLILACGGGTADVVGHDWGAIAEPPGSWRCATPSAWKSSRYLTSLTRLASRMGP
jgi:pimeloyl-ACP methyl ester carboxylesterase